ncbi:MAG: tail fiber domain-containing protein [bacterium]|nr:tail fiber domain-containing protein [bacterium]
MGKFKPNKDFTLISRVANQTPYSQEYLSLLVRKNKIKGKKLNGIWHVSQTDLKRYLNEQGIIMPNGETPMLVAKGENVNGVFVPKAYRVINKAVLANEPESEIPNNLQNTNLNSKGSTFSSSGILRSNLKSLNPQGQTLRAVPRSDLKSENNLTADVRSELDRLEEIYQQKNSKTQDTNYKQITNEEKEISKKEFQGQTFSSKGILRSDLKEEESKSEFNFPKLKANSYKLEANSYSTSKFVQIVSVSVVSIVLVLGGFNLKFANAIYGAVKTFVEDAVTLQGKAPGTGANEILLINKDGDISIAGHIETKKQFRSYAKDGIAPIIVDSKTTAVNLSADYLDGLSNQDFTLQLVTKNGNVTFDNVKLEGGAEVGSLLLVKGAASFLNYVTISNDLFVGGKASISNGLDVIGNSTLIGRLTLKGDIDATGFIAAQRAQIKEGGLVVGGATVLNSLGVTGGASMSDLGISGNFSVAGKEISLGDSGSDKMTVNASSTFKGPFEVTAYEAKFGRGITIQSSGLSVTGSTNITGSTSFTGNSTITGDLTVSGSGSFGSFSINELGLGTSTPASKLAVTGAGTFDGFISANYFTSTSSLTSWIMGQFGIGTTTPGAKMGVRGAGIFDGFVSADYFTSTSTNNNWFMGNLGIGTSTPTTKLEVNGSALIKTNLTVEGNIKATSVNVTSTTVASGSTSTPAYSFSNDTNTGITSGGDDDFLSLITGGITRLGINKNGNIGIATSSAGSLLSIQGNANIGELTVEGQFKTSFITSTSTSDSYFRGSVGFGTTTPGTALAVKGAGMFDGFVSADYFTSTSTNTNWFNGALGLGTTTPSTALSVNGSILSEGFISADYFTSTSTNSSWLMGRLGLGTTTPVGTLTISNDTTNSTNNLIEAVNSVGSYNFVVTNGGSVGIGTYNPSGYLSVYGNTYLATTEGNVGIGTTSPGNLLDVNGSVGVESFYVQGTSTMSSLIATSTLEVRSSAYTGGSLFNTFKEKIGIGTSTAGSLLSVHGNANIGELTIEGQLKTSFITATSTTNNTFAGALDVTESATSTFTGGVNVLTTGGLSSATGLTITGGDILSSGKLTLTSASTSTIPQLNVSTIFTTPTLEVSTIIKNSGTATSTFAGGGLFATGGLSTNALNVTSDSLFTGKLTSGSSATSTLPNLNASTIFTTPILDVSTIIKNSGTATSTFAGGLSLGTGGLNITSGGLYVDVGDVTFDQKLIVNGNVGIGITAPSSKFNVVDQGQNNEARFDTYSDTDGHASLFRFRKAGGTLASPTTVATGEVIAAMGFSAYDGATFLNGAQIRSDVTTYTGTDNIATNMSFWTRATGGGNVAERMRIDSAGNVGIGDTTPDYGLDVVADINSDDCFREAGAQIAGTCASDINLKQNVNTLENSLSKILQLRPVTFEWREGIDSNEGIRYIEGTQTGLIAQEVETVFPEWVSTKHGFKAVSYNLELQMRLTKAIQELYASTSPLTSNIFVTSDGNISIGSTTPMYKLSVDGDIAATSFINISTASSKKDIEYLDSTDDQSILNKIKDIKVATYNYIGEECNSVTSNSVITELPSYQVTGCKNRLGLIAEESPQEILSISGKGVDIYKLSTFILAGVKAQQIQIEKLATRVASLENREWNVEGSNSPSNNLLSNIYSLPSTIYTVAKTTLANIVSSVGDWANAVLADTTKLKVSIENENEIKYETYGVDSTRKEITASGKAQLIFKADSNGEIVNARIKFDESFSSVITNADELRIIITPAGKVNGTLYVNDRSIYGFEVREAGAQDNGAWFDWMVVARKKGGEDAVISPISPIGPIAPEEPMDSPSSPPSAPVVEEVLPIPPAEEIAPIIVPAEETVPVPTEEVAPVPAEEILPATEEPINP